MKKIIFSDLDGTLLDHDTYSYSQAKEALIQIKNQNIPLIFCSSKTRSEIEYWQKKIGIKDPFISENGGGIFIPKTYFTIEYPYNRQYRQYYIIDLGVNYKQLSNIFKKLKEKFEVKSFTDMDPQDIANDSNLTVSQAELARNRDYDVPFKIINKKHTKKIISFIEKQGYNITMGGRYYHLVGDNDKGKAVQILIQLFTTESDNTYTIGIGDSENDFAMLEQVDNPYLVRKKDGRYASTKYQLAVGIGPDGWRKVINSELNP